MKNLAHKACGALLCAVLAVVGVCGLPSSVHALSQEAQSAVPKAPTANQPSGDIPDWQARLELARLLSYVKRYDESLVEYGKVLAEKPELVEAKAEMARVLMWSGKTKEAKALLDSIAPDQLSGEDRLLQADLFAMRKEYGKAESIYRELLQASPENQAIQLRLAEVLSWTKRYAESLKLYEKLVVAAPQDVQLRRRYAQTLSWAGKTQEAIREFRRSLGQ